MAKDINRIACTTYKIPGRPKTKGKQPSKPKAVKAKPEN
jgi:hypothetical protein